MMTKKRNIKKMRFLAVEIESVVFKTKDLKDSDGR